MDRRWTAIAVIGAAGLLLVGGLVTGRWLIGSFAGDDIRVGLLGFSACGSGACVSSPFDALPSPGAMPAMGTLMLIFGIACIASLALCAGLAARKRVVDWFIAPETLAIVSCALSLVFAVVTVVAFQSALRDLQLGTGPSFLLFGLGCAIGLFGAILLGRLPRDDTLHFEPPFDPI